METALRVGIDGRSLAQSAAGVSRYIIELCRAVDKVLPEGQFYVYSLNPVRVRMPSRRWTVRSERHPAFRRIFSAMTVTLPWFRYRVGALCESDGVNVFWGTQTILPRLSNGARTVATVHDLNLIVAPQTMRWRSVIGQRLLFKRSLAEADAICTNSRGTAKRLRDLLGYESDAVITPAVSAHFRPPQHDELAACLRLYGVQKPYFMAIGTWEPRKNLAMLIRTFVQMKKEGLLSRYTLILIGGRGWSDQKLAMLIAHTDRDVIALGFVPDRDLPALYAGCTALVFPSLYEGFGIPLLEARACGARVVATDLVELRESGGEHSIYIPASPEGIRTGMMRAASEPAQPQPAPEPLQSWENGGTVLARLFVNLLNEHRRPRSTH